MTMKAKPKEVSWVQGGSWIQILPVRLDNLVARKLTCDVSSRTYYIAWLSNLLYDPQTMFHIQPSFRSKIHIHLYHLLYSYFEYHELFGYISYL